MKCGECGASTFNPKRDDIGYEYEDGTILKVQGWKCKHCQTLHDLPGAVKESEDAHREGREQRKVLAKRTIA